MKKFSLRYILDHSFDSFSCFAFICLISTGCSPMKVTSDYDKNADFNAYKTYSYTQSVNTLTLQSANKELLVSSVTREMNARGYRKSNSLVTDVLVDLYIEYDKTLKTTQTNDQIMGMRPYRYGGGFSNTSVDQHIFKQGTLLIDIIDGKKNEIVWEGRATTALKEDQPDMEKEKQINEAVRRIFEKYPVGISRDK
jgi:hypothetical protein